MTTIRVSGAGLVINSEVAIITDALQQLGYIVIVDNEYADGASIEEIKQHVREVNSGARDTSSSRCGPMTVKIIANHIPWGG